jgi:anti-sigma factor RsiW
MAKASDISCQELVELVSEYLEGALSRRDRKRFEAHIRACDGCAAYVEQVRETIEAAGRITAAESLDPDARDALLHAFREWKSGRAAH